jgi:hypothetical protein
MHIFYAAVFIYKVYIDLFNFLHNPFGWTLAKEMIVCLIIHVCGEWLVTDESENCQACKDRFQKLCQ